MWISTSICRSNNPKPLKRAHRNLPCARFFMAAPHNSARDSSERFCSKIKFENRRNTLCPRKGYAASVSHLALATAALYPQGVCRIRKPSCAGNGCAIFQVFQTAILGQKIRCCPQTQLFGVALCYACRLSFSPPAMSRITWPARISPAAPGTKETLPGIWRLPSAAASSSQPVGVRASSWE